MFTNFSYSQERLSSIVSSSDNSRNLFEKVNGKNYLLTIYNDDELEIGEIDSLWNYEQKSKIYLEGIFDHQYINIYKKWIYYDTEDGYVIYDYINDKISENPLPDSKKINFWGNPDDEGVFLYLSKPEVYFPEPIFVDFENGTIENYSLPRIINKRDGDYVVASVKSNNKYHHQLLNFKTGDTTDLYDFAKNNTYSFLNENFLWYQNDLGQITEIDIKTKEKFIYENTVNSILRNNTIIVKDNKIYVFNSNYGELNVQILSRDTKELLYNQHFEHNFYDNGDYYTGIIKVSNFQIYDDKILGLSDARSIIIFDLTSKKVSEFYTPIDDIKRFTIQDNDKIINFNGNSFSTIDLNSYEEQKLDGDYVIANSSNFNFTKIGNNVLGYIDYGYLFHVFPNAYSNINLYKFDLEHNKYAYANQLIFTNGGLDYISKLYNLNDEILLLSDNLYHFTDTIKRVNTSSIYKLNRGKLYTLEEDYLYFTQNIVTDTSNIYEIFKFDGIASPEKILDIKIEFPYTYKITDYSFLDNTLYYIDNSRRMYRIDPNKDEPEFIPDNSAVTSIFGKFNNTLYYIDYSKIKNIKNNQTPTKISNELNLLYSNLFTFKNRLFFFVFDSFYEIIGNELKLVYTTKNNNTLGVKYYDESRNKSIIIPSYLTTYHFDGTNMHEIGIESNNIKNLIGNIFRINNSFYDGDNKQVINLPSSMQEENILDLYTNDNDTILLTYIIEGKDFSIKSYNIKNHLSEFELIKNHDDYGKFENSRFYEDGNRGMIYSENKIYILNEDMNLNLLKEPTGTRTYSNVILKDGYLYFIANDKYIGNQIYRISLNGTGIEYSNSEIKKILISPNPASNIIRINEEFNIKFAFAISVNGNKIDRVIRNNSIDISDLKPGTYIILFETKDKKIFYNKLVKIK